MVEDKTMAILKANMQARKPIMIVGAPGTGKTATIRDITEKMGYELIILIGSQMDPTDVRGLPSGQQTGEKEDGTPLFSAEYLSPIFQTNILQKKKVVVFFDEFSNTPPATRASLLTFLQDREFPNGEKLPEETIVIGAMNPPEEAADGFELDLPTKNRLFFIPWEPSIESWCEGMLDNWGNECSEKEMLWRQRIVSFIRDNPDQLQKPPKISGTPEAYGISSNDPSKLCVAQSAWASRRSWNDLSHTLSFVEDDNDTYVQDMIFEGTIGVSGAFEFRDWLRTNSIVSPSEALKNPDIINWENLSLNDSNLMLRGIVEIINKDNVLQVINLIKSALDNNKGHLLGAYLSQILGAVTEIQGKDPDISKKFKADFTKLLPRLQPFIKS